MCVCVFIWACVYWSADLTPVVCGIITDSIISAVASALQLMSPYRTLHGPSGNHCVFVCVYVCVCMSVCVYECVCDQWLTSLIDELKGNELSMSTGTRKGCKQ